MVFLLSLLTMKVVLMFRFIFYIDKKEGQTKSPWSEYSLKGKIISIVIFVSLILITIPVASSYFGAESSSSRWDSLSDDEKNWYKNNYGGGKMDDINNAIKDYRGY